MPYSLSGTFEEAMDALRTSYVEKRAVPGLGFLGGLLGSTLNRATGAGDSVAAWWKNLSPEAKASILSGVGGATVGAGMEYGKPKEERSYLRGMGLGGLLGGGLGYGGSKLLSSLSAKPNFEYTGPDGKPQAVPTSNLVDFLQKEQTPDYKQNVKDLVQGVGSAAKTTGDVVSDAVVPHRGLLGAQVGLHGAKNLGLLPGFGKITPQNSSSVNQFRFGLQDIANPADAAAKATIAPDRAKRLVDALDANPDIAKSTLQRYSLGDKAPVGDLAYATDPAKRSPPFNFGKGPTARPSQYSPSFQANYPAFASSANQKPLDLVLSRGDVEAVMTRGRKPYLQSGARPYQAFGRQFEGRRGGGLMRGGLYYALPQLAAHMMTPNLTTPEEGSRRFADQLRNVWMNTR